MSNTSYYLYQKYEQRGGQDPIPVYPNYWSVDGDGTMPKVKKQDNDPSCGYVPPVTAIYRWVNIDITKDYVCDECPQYRTISTGYTCVGYDKHYLDEYQVSYDAGATWQTLSSSTGSLIETDSEYCGYVPPVIAQKFRATYSGGKTYSAACDSSTELTTGDTKPSGYEYSAMTSAVIGDCVTSIGNHVLSIYPDSFSSIIITVPDSVTTIGNGVFCSGEKGIERGADIEVYIGSGVTSIGTHFLQNNPGWHKVGSTKLTITATTPPTLGQYAMYPNEMSTIDIFVPASSVNAYKTASGWSEFADRIQAIS